MARGVNKVILIGNVGADPETRHMPNGDAVTNVRLATSETWRDKQSGEQQERTEWHRLVFFRRLAEIAGQYLRKGSQCYIEGRIHTNKWTDRDGKDRYTTEIVVDQMNMLGDGKGGGSGDGWRKKEQDNGYAQAKGRTRQAAGHAPPEDFDDLDDVPF